VHEIEREVEPDDEQPEVNPREPLAVHPAGNLREPVVEGSKDGEQDAADDDVMEMRDHEIRVTELPIERCRAEHDAGQAGHQELK